MAELGLRAGAPALDLVSCSPGQQLEERTEEGRVEERTETFMGDLVKREVTGKAGWWRFGKRKVEKPLDSYERENSTESRQTDRRWLRLTGFDHSSSQNPFSFSLPPSVSHSL